MLFIPIQQPTSSTLAVLVSLFGTTTKMQHKKVYPQITQIAQIKHSYFCENLCNLWILNSFWPSLQTRVLESGTPLVLLCG